MHILNDKLRNTYHAIKAAAVVNRIKEVITEQHDPGQSIDPPQMDVIAGIPKSLPNQEVTEPDAPLDSSTPSEDPEFEGAIAGSGSGPSMESRTNYNR